MLSIALVIVVVFIFLRSGRATLIPAVAVPVSLIGTFAVMYLCGYSLDNLSLMALTISTGFVVDDAIVVMENITRHIEDGMEPFAAALKGAQGDWLYGFYDQHVVDCRLHPASNDGRDRRQAVPGVCGHTFDCNSGIDGDFFDHDTDDVRLYLEEPHKEKHGRLYMATDRVFDWVLSLYRRSLHWVLENPVLILDGLVSYDCTERCDCIKIPKGFFPAAGHGLAGWGRAWTSGRLFPSMNDAIKQILKVVKNDPAVAECDLVYWGRGSSNTANMFVSLKPLEERKISASDVINRLRPKLNRLDGGVFVSAGGAGPSHRRDAAAMRFISTRFRPTILPISRRGGPGCSTEMMKLPGFQDVSSDQQNGGLDELLHYDRVTAAQLGQTAQSLDRGLYSAFGQSEVSLIYTQLNQYYVVLEVAPEYWQTPEGLKDIYFHPPGTSSTTASGNVPLCRIATAKTNTTPLALNHTGLFPSVTVSFNLAPGVSLSDATLEIAQMQQQLGTPSTVHGFFAGTLLAYQQSLGTEPLLVVTAILAVFIVLGILYESLVHPITIISTLPSASVGAMMALMIFKEDLNVISIIGIVLLIGIVKKNAIMMIDFALQAEREGGMNTEDAIFEACMLRFRPILMTTMAALFGALPLAFGTGTGSELRRPLGYHYCWGVDRESDAYSLYHSCRLSCARPFAPACDGERTRYVSSDRRPSAAGAD